MNTRCDAHNKHYVNTSCVKYHGKLAGRTSEWGF